MNDVSEKLLAQRVCGVCYHWERYPDSAQVVGEDITGECTLHPPKIIELDSEGVIVQARPVMEFRERCGQYFPKVN